MCWSLFKEWLMKHAQVIFRFMTPRQPWVRMYAIVIQRSRKRSYYQSHMQTWWLRHKPQDSYPHHTHSPTCSWQYSTLQWEHRSWAAFDADSEQIAHTRRTVPGKICKSWGPACRGRWRWFTSPAARAHLGRLAFEPYWSTGPLSKLFGQSLKNGGAGSFRRAID